MGANSRCQVKQVSAADMVRTYIRLFEPRIYGRTDLVGGDDFRLQQLTDGGVLSHVRGIPRLPSLSSSKRPKRHRAARAAGGITIVSRVEEGHPVGCNGRHRSI